MRVKDNDNKYCQSFPLLMPRTKTRSRHVDSQTFPSVPHMGKTTQTCPKNSAAAGQQPRQQFSLSGHRRTDCLRCGNMPRLRLCPCKRYRTSDRPRLCAAEDVCHKVSPRYESTWTPYSSSGLCGRANFHWLDELFRRLTVTRQVRDGALRLALHYMLLYPRRSANHDAHGRRGGAGTTQQQNVGEATPTTVSVDRVSFPSISCETLSDSAPAPLQLQPPYSELEKKLSFDGLSSQWLKRRSSPLLSLGVLLPTPPTTNARVPLSY